MFWSLQKQQRALNITTGPWQGRWSSSSTSGWAGFSHTFWFKCRILEFNQKMFHLFCFASLQLYLCQSPIKLEFLDQAYNGMNSFLSWAFNVLPTFGGWSLSQLPSGQRQGTPLTSHQLIVELETNTHSHIRTNPEAFEPGTFYKKTKKKVFWFFLL